MPNTITTSLKQSFLLIKKHKGLTTAIFFLQLVLIASSLMFSFYYSSRIIEPLQEAKEYIANIDLSDTAVAGSLMPGGNLLGDDPLMIRRNIELVKSLTMKLSVSVVLVFLILSSIIWGLTSRLIQNKNKKKFLRYIGEFLIAAVGFGALSMLFIYLGVSDMVARFIAEETPGVLSFIYLALGLIVVYFMFISFASIQKFKLKELLKKTAIIGTKKAHIILLTYLIILVIIGLFGWLVYLLSENNLALLLSVMLLLVFSFVWSRILLITVVDKLKV